MKKELFFLLVLGTSFTAFGACNRNNEVSRAYPQNGDKQSQLMREKADRQVGKSKKSFQAKRKAEEAKRKAALLGENLDARATLSQEDIRTAQSKLIDLGYLKGSTDGLIGKDTVNATKRFQAAEKLPVTGVFTKNTMDHLDTARHLAE